MRNHARNAILRLAAIDPTDTAGVVGIIKGAIDDAVSEERERCAHIALAIDSGRGNEKLIADSIRKPNE